MNSSGASKTGKGREPENTTATTRNSSGSRERVSRHGNDQDSGSRGPSLRSTSIGSSYSYEESPIEDIFEPREVPLEDVTFGKILDFLHASNLLMLDLELGNIILSYKTWPSADSDRALDRTIQLSFSRLRPSQGDIMRSENTDLNCSRELLLNPNFNVAPRYFPPSNLTPLDAAENGDRGPYHVLEYFYHDNAEGASSRKKALDFIPDPTGPPAPIYSQRRGDKELEVQFTIPFSNASNKSENNVTVAGAVGKTKFRIEAPPTANDKERISACIHANLPLRRDERDATCIPIKIRFRFIEALTAPGLPVDARFAWEILFHRGLRFTWVLDVEFAFKSIWASRAEAARLAAELHKLGREMEVSENADRNTAFTRTQTEGEFWKR